MDRNSQTLCRTATQVIFACFLGYCVLATVYVSSNHAARSWLFRITLLVLSFLLCCAVMTYIRPRGLPAYVVSTAMIGIVAVHGTFVVVELLRPRGPWGIVAAGIAFSAWVFLGFRKTIAEISRGKADE